MKERDITRNSKSMHRLIKVSSRCILFEFPDKVTPTEFYKITMMR